MPWVYRLELSEYREAKSVQSDWESIASEQIAHDHGGITVAGGENGATAVVVSTPREPNYSDMEGMGYVVSVEEYKDIPANPSGAVELANGIWIDPR